MIFEFDLTELAIAAVYIVFAGVIIPIGRAVWQWIKTRTTNDKLLAAISEAEGVAFNAVADLQNSLVDGLKAAAPDGKLTPEQIAEVSREAFNRFMASISKGALDTLKNHKENLADYVKGLIEAQLERLKLARKAAASK